MPAEEFPICRLSDFLRDQVNIAQNKAQSTKRGKIHITTSHPQCSTIPEYSDLVMSLATAGKTKAYRDINVSSWSSSPLSPQLSLINNRKPRAKKSCEFQNAKLIMLIQLYIVGKN